MVKVWRLTKLVRLGNGLLISVYVLGGFDRMSLFAMIFGFVVIGLLIARRRFTASK